MEFSEGYRGEKASKSCFILLHIIPSKNCIILFKAHYYNDQKAEFVLNVSKIILRFMNINLLCWIRCSNSHSVVHIFESIY